MPLTTHPWRRAVATAALLQVAAAQSSAWQPLSGCSSWAVSNARYTITGAAFMEVDVAPDSYATRYVGSTASGSVAGAGSTRFTMAVNIRSSGAAVDGAVLFVAHLHASRCSVLPPGGPHYLQNTSLGDDALIPPISAGTRQGVNTMSLRVSPVNASSSATQPWLVDYDRALSVVVHEPSASAAYSPTAMGARFACCNLVPNLPDMPPEWSSIIEANFQGVGKAYTMTRQEFYSTTLNKVAIVQHTNMARTVEVQHLSTNTTFALSQNASYPSGLCVQSIIGRGPQNAMMASNGQLKSTSDFLMFDPSQPIAFDGTNVVNVRGISCERWTRAYNFSFGPGEGSVGIAAYYFPVSSWNNRGETFHRLIKRVEINGTHYSARSGNRVYVHSYEFVNFVPAVTNMDVFDPCYVLQMGPLGTSRSISVTGCGCESRPGVQAAPVTVVQQNVNVGVKGYSSGSMAAVGIIVPLITLVLGAGVGICMERRAKRQLSPAHDEIALTSSMG